MKKIDFNDNRTLIQLLKKGDENAYSFLVDRYNHQLCIYADSLGNNPSMASDIVQNVFVKTWEKRHHLKDDFSIKSFLYRSVYNEFVDQYRKQQSVMILEKKYIDALDAIVEDNDSTIKKYIALVRQEIQNLPPKCKRTFILSKHEGLTNVEIAEYLDVSIKTVEAQITKAFTLLRKKLNTEDVNLFFLLLKGYKTSGNLNL